MKKVVRYLLITAILSFTLPHLAAQDFENEPACTLEQLQGLYPGFPF